MVETTDHSLRRRRRRESPEVRQEQLLDAAERVLLDRGLAATTIADVALAAGVAKGTVYLYFLSKTELLAAVRARYVQRTASALAEAIQSTGSVRTKLDRFVDAFFEICIEHRRLHHLLFHEAGFSEDDALPHTRAVLAQVVAEGLADGTFVAEDADIATDFVLAGIHAALVSLMHGHDRDRRRFVSSVKRTSRRTLGTS